MTIDIGICGFVFLIGLGMTQSRSGTTRGMGVCLSIFSLTLILLQL